jgi:hypothetical protein
MYINLTDIYTIVKKSLKYFKNFKNFKRKIKGKFLTFIILTDVFKGF